MTLRYHSCGLAALGLTCLASSAMAATAAEPAQTTEPALSASTTPKDTQLDTLTISGQLLAPYRMTTGSTAMGTNTPLQDTPFSISSVPDEVLRDQDAQSLADAVRNTPGVSVVMGEGNRDELMLRGVSTKSDFFMNGMRDDSEYYRPLYNVDHVDVLKGPAALRFGRAGAGGIVNYVTRPAVRTDIRQVTIEGGSWSHGKATFDYGTPVADHAAFRLMGMIDHSNGFRDHDWVHRFAINPKMHFGLTPDTDLDISLSYLNDRRFVDRGIPSENGRPVAVPRDQFFGSVDQNRSHTKVGTGNIKLTHQVNEQFKLRNNLRVAHTDRQYANIYPLHAVQNGTASLKGYSHPSERWTFQDRFEGILDFDTGHIEHTLLTGLELTRQHDHDVEWRPTAGNGDKDIPQYGSVPLSNTEVAPVPMGFLDRDNTVRVNEIGVFAQDQIKLDEHWQLLAGLRFDHFRMSGIWHSEDKTTHVVSRTGDTTQTDNTLSPRAAVMYKPVTNDTVYVSFSRTYTPSGANLALSLKSPDSANLSPERADAWEVGNKLSLLNDDLLLGVALYQINLTNRDTELSSGRHVAVGKLRNRGIEVYGHGNLTDAWGVFASYAYMDSEFVTPVKKGQYQGNRPQLVPRNQFSVWTTYALNKHWGIGAGLHGTSARFASYENEVTLPGYAVGDLMAWYETDGYRLQLNIDNVTNKHYYATAQGSNQIMPGTPLQVMASLTVDLP